MQLFDQRSILFLSIRNKAEQPSNLSGEYIYNIYKLIYVNVCYVSLVITALKTKNK